MDKGINFNGPPKTVAEQQERLTYLFACGLRRSLIRAAEADRKKAAAAKQSQIA